MKCFFKRSLSFCISLIMLFSIFTVFQIPLMATGSVKLRLDSFIEEYPAGQKWNDSFAGGFQCYGFAKLVIYNLFGNKNSGYRSWKYDGTPTNGMTVLGSVTNFSSDNVWALLSLAECGDVLQFDSPKQHSMIVYSVVSDGAWIYDCNYLMTNTINLRKVSFGEWYGMQRIAGGNPGRILHPADPLPGICQRSFESSACATAAEQHGKRIPKCRRS